jgi:hypothetical protein
VILNIVLVGIDLFMVGLIVYLYRAMRAAERRIFDLTWELDDSRGIIVRLVRLVKGKE